MTTIEQFLRIALYNGGAMIFGKAVADGDQYQAAMGGAIAIATFAWWLYRNRKGGKV